MSNRFNLKKAEKSNDDDDLLEKQLSALGDISGESDNDQPSIEKSPVLYTIPQQIAKQGEQSIIQKDVVIEGSIKSASALSIFGTVNGNIVCDNDITINGNITGDIKATNLQLIAGQINGNIECKQTATINKTSAIKGNINGVSLNCDGRIDGNIKLSGNVVLKENSVVIGDIISKKISINEGAVCRGKIQIDFADPLKNEDTTASVVSSIKDINLHKYI